MEADEIEGVEMSSQMPEHETQSLGGVIEAQHGGDEVVRQQSPRRERQAIEDRGKIIAGIVNRNAGAQLRFEHARAIERIRDEPQRIRRVRRFD
jgi:hypothetical protein